VAEIACEAGTSHDGPGRGGVDPRRGLVVTGEVVGHQHYGPVVLVDTGERGFVDSADVSDARPVPVDLWPAVGDRVRAVVLGVARDGRVRLSLRGLDESLATNRGCDR
jgi:predicted RNA-binding protein with RPS1 domain